MLKITIVETLDGVDVTTTKEFSETDHLALLNDLTSYTSWLFPANDRGGPVFHKVYQCRKRMVEPNLKKYLNDASVNSEDEIINAVVAESGYLNRAADQAAAAAADQAAADQAAADQAAADQAAADQAAADQAAADEAE